MLKMGSPRRALAVAAAIVVAVPAAGALAGSQRQGDVNDLPARLDPQVLGGHFFGPSLNRAEVVVTVRGQPRLYRLDRGRVVATSPDAIVLRERDGTSATVPVNAATRVVARGRVVSLAEAKRGIWVLTIREGDAPAVAVNILGRRG